LNHHLRSDRTCLNCGAEVQDRYCSHCGQENLEPKENIGHLIGHFFSDLTHYDSKFFLTLKHLFLRPGFLTKEYFLGRRARYFNPVRMYFFISFVFFLLYLSIPNKKIHFLSFKLRSTQTTIQIGNSSFAFGFASRSYKSVHEYDSIQKNLPVEDKDFVITRLSMQHYLRMREKYGDNADEVFAENLRHNIPKIMFLFLPFFALFLKWAYNKRKYVYVDHAIFSVHFHVFVFTLFFVFTILGLFIFIPVWIAILGAFIYLVIALRNAYEQSFLRSFAKALLLSIIYLFVVYVGGQIMAITTFFLTE